MREGLTKAMGVFEQGNGGCEFCWEGSRSVLVGALSSFLSCPPPHSLRDIAALARRQPESQTRACCVTQAVLPFSES